MPQLTPGRGAWGSWTCHFPHFRCPHRPPLLSSPLPPLHLLPTRSRATSSLPVVLKRNLQHVHEFHRAQIVPCPRFLLGGCLALACAGPSLNGHIVGLAGAGREGRYEDVGNQLHLSPLSCAGRAEEVVVGRGVDGYDVQRVVVSVSVTLAGGRF
ncbi:hypothetical protein EDB89DRAFT_108053 [Lactarius sanguifluus]|nr:hypothetical protein EDB89DRAFT_108053 [Lactarius sanguifluus]